jgi:uncharacterized protein YqgC (DUF456 family)
VGYSAECYWSPSRWRCGVLSVIARSVEFVADAMGAMRIGASSRALWGATIGTFCGIPGLFVGAV